MEKIRTKVKEAKRIVIKIGTSSLILPTGDIAYQTIDRLAYVLTVLMNQGKEIVLVSSGAIGVGLNMLQLKERPKTIPEQQAIASIGQNELMNLYSRFFSHYNQKVGQVLMTRDIVDFPESRSNAVNALEALIRMRIIPIVNENDAVSVEELDHITKFGDNDRLSATVAEIVNADLLIMLTDVAGFYDKNPDKHPDARLFKTIYEITDKEMSYAGGAGSDLGTGGMYTKLLAAQQILANKQQMILTHATDPTVLFRLLEGEPLGTYFVAEGSMEDHKEEAK